ncbi:ferredoxin [Pseudolactococcus yaeyamensis]
MTIQIIPEQCIACGLCHTYNPIFNYNVDGLVHFDTSDTELVLTPDASLVQAAKECPTSAIIIKTY